MGILDALKTTMPPKQAAQVVSTAGEQQATPAFACQDCGPSSPTWLDPFGRWRCERCSPPQSKAFVRARRGRDKGVLGSGSTSGGPESPGCVQDASRGGADIPSLADDPEGWAMSQRLLVGYWLRGRDGRLRQVVRIGTRRPGDCPPGMLVEDWWEALQRLMLEEKKA